MYSIGLVKKNDVAVRVSQVILFTLLMVCAAYIRIPLPFTPVPLTLQTLIVYLGIGFLRQRAVYAQIAYLALGIFGLPIFTNAGSGFAYLLGPTGGYLLGFLAATLLFANLIQEPVSFKGRVFRYIGVSFVIYACGAGGLALFSHCSSLVALQLGVVPFLAGEAMKLSVAIAILKK